MDYSGIDQHHLGAWRESAFQSLKIEVEMGISGDDFGHATVVVDVEVILDEIRGEEDNLVARVRSVFRTTLIPAAAPTHMTMCSAMNDAGFFHQLRRHCSARL